MALKDNCSQKEKKIRKDKHDEKTSKSKSKFYGEELLGPQASLRVTPYPPAPNHTRGEVIRPPSQIENNSYSVIRTHDLDDLTCTRCAPTITSRPSGICIINWCCKYKLQDDKSFTRHEKCISRNRKNTNREKVENFF